MGSGNWQTWTITKILADEVYVGDMVQGKTKTIGHKQVPTEPEEWIVVRDTHEPLIRRELFEKVQELRRQAAEKAEIRPVSLIQKMSCAAVSSAAIAERTSTANAPMGYIISTASPTAGLPKTTAPAYV